MERHHRLLQAEATGQMESQQKCPPCDRVATAVIVAVGVLLTPVRSPCVCVSQAIRCDSGSGSERLRRDGKPKVTPSKAINMQCDSVERLRKAQLQQTRANHSGRRTRHVSRAGSPTFILLCMCTCPEMQQRRSWSLPRRALQAKTELVSSRACSEISKGCSPHIGQTCAAASKKLSVLDAVRSALTTTTALDDQPCCAPIHSLSN